MSRESLAHALSGPVSLAEDQWRERDVDRLHALAAAQARGVNRSMRSANLSALGVSMIALKAANRPDEYARAVNRLADLIAHSIRPKANAEMRIRIARQAVSEHIIDFCPTCNGTGEVRDQEGLEGAQPMKPCPECHGHGRRRYTDSERVEAMGIKSPHDADKWISHALAVISMAEDEATRTAQILLERWR